MTVLVWLNATETGMSTVTFHENVGRVIGGYGNWDT